MLPNVDSDETVTGAVDATVCGEVSVTAALDADVCCSRIFTMRFIYHTHFSLFKLHIIIFLKTFLLVINYYNACNVSHNINEYIIKETCKTNGKMITIFYICCRRNIVHGISV